MRNMDGYPGDMIRRLNDRNLFKRALYVGFESVDKTIVRYSKSHREIETEIARMAGVDPGYVIVDIPKVPEFRERNTKVLMENDQLKYIDDVSNVARIMEESYVSGLAHGRLHAARVPRARGKDRQRLLQRRKDAEAK